MKYDEFKLEDDCVKLGKEQFLRQLAIIENQAKSRYESQGWDYVKTAKRTVIFSIGEITFYRKCYAKKGEYIYPLDEALNLRKYMRFSNSFLMQVAELASKMPYRKVVEVFELLKGIVITKDVVLKAVKLATELYRDHDIYLQDTVVGKNSNLKEVPIIYVEGDGIFIKSRNEEKKSKELPHFVVHEGAETEYNNRLYLKNKNEFLGGSHFQTKEKLFNYLYTNYNITDETLLVTNSDLGLGYRPRTFIELAKSLGCRHLHFWDKYHLYRQIDISYRNVKVELKQKLIESLKIQDKKLTKSILNKSLCEIKDKTNREKFIDFAKMLLENYEYTHERPIGIKNGVGVMESQQSKIANRMKRRGMYWSNDGAVTMARLIIDVSEKKLKDLFLGEWREKNIEQKSMKYNAGHHIVSNQESQLKRGKLLAPRIKL